MRNILIMFRSSFVVFTYDYFGYGRWDSRKKVLFINYLCLLLPTSESVTQSCCLS